jgi:hypothetical protein
MNTTTTKIAGEAMTDEQIKDLAKQHYAMYDHWQIDLVGFARALLASKPAVPQTLSDGAQYFARYLIDNCENEVIREESVQAWLGKMLASPRYHPTAPAQSCESCEGEGIIDCYACPDCADHIQQIANKTTSTHGTSWWTFNKEELVAFAEAVKAKPTAPAQSCGDAEQADEALTDTERLNFLRDETLDLRCIDVPTGGDDADVRWIVIEHHMSKPHEREIARSFTDDPREAIDAARAKDSK